MILKAEIKAICVIHSIFRANVLACCAGYAFGGHHPSIYVLILH